MRSSHRGSCATKNTISLFALSAVLCTLLSMTLVSTAYANPYNRTSDLGSGGSIHIFAFESTDAILIESNGLYGMVDSGEDSDYPDGTDEKYPLRPGITQGKGKEDQVISYLYSLGVNKDNFVFYIGTHAHSDHIGSADEIIEEFEPDYVYAPLYDDSYITNPSRLWDNQYVYDRMIAAAKDVNADIFQKLSERQRTFSLGALSISIVNYRDIDEDFRVDDANDYSWGVKVSDGVSSVLLMGDINNTLGSETEIASQVGHVDAIKLGHHGNAGSSTPEFLSSITPKTAVLTGSITKLPDDVSDMLFELKTRVIAAPEAIENEEQTIILKFTVNGIEDNIPFDSSVVKYRIRKSSPYLTASVNYEPAILNGWVKYDSSWYWFENTSTALESSWKEENGKWYYLSDTGKMEVGWFQVNDEWYFSSSSGVVQIGWKEISDEWYYLNSSGEMQTGWLKTGGKWYYLDSNGAMATGWKKLSGKWYYLNSSGAMQTGWEKVDGIWYYLNSSGVMQTGWEKVSGKWYYLNSSGEMQTGWIKLSGKWYYLSSNGAMQTGWEQVGKTWYYMNSSGVMQTGWLKTGGKWYYLNGSGAMQTGWEKISGKWYYLNSSGAMQTGWEKVSGKWYYLNSSGVMQANKWIGDYYVQSDGSMATNKWIGSYYVGSDGRWIKNYGSSGSSSSSPEVVDVVYWTANGEVYHSTKNCPSLANSKKIFSGSITEAMGEGKSRECRNCW